MQKMPDEIYDEDYYERGIESRKSCYQNYRWIPELTMPMAMSIIDYLGVKRGAKVLDFGCAKGYLVKALRLLYRDAYGFDISRYAISKCDEMVKHCCSTKMPDPGPEGFDVCVAKDVLEHIPENALSKVLKSIKAKTLFAVIPVGSNGDGFVAPVNNMDVTHVTCVPVEQWMAIFTLNKWEVTRFTYSVPGIKESYKEKYPKAHAFFTAKRRW